MHRRNLKRIVLHTVLATLATGGITGCALDHLVRVDDPDQSAVVTREHVNSYSGALGLYYSAIGATRLAIKGLTQESAIFTDELASWTFLNVVDQRYSEDGKGLVLNSYGALQTARIRSAQASEVLLLFGSERDYPLVGNAYAMQAYAILALAEHLCSGVPLTTAPFEKNMQYTRGFTTNELLEQAVMFFDSAYHYGKDSLPIATFAQVGKGRALLGLGKYQEAAEAVATVQTSAQYLVEFSSAAGGVPYWQTANSTATAILNNDGLNGLVWVTPGVDDPRVPALVRTSETNSNRNGIWQQKYPTPIVNVVLADGIQARLIEAEAQLQPASTPSGPWLATLNAARATVGLADTTDPGTAKGRISLLFRERAFWAFLNAQRLGDWRRLVRNYGWPKDDVYPSGEFKIRSTTSSYRGGAFLGDEAVFVPPEAEMQLNPLYEGCINRNP